MDTLPTEMTVGGRSYEILGFLEAGETLIASHIMVDRTKKMNANLGKDDGEHILKHQDEIPASLRGKVIFLFPDWRRHPNNPKGARGVYWDGAQWSRIWYRFGGSRWNGRGRVLRRK